MIYFKVAPNWGVHYRDYLVPKARAEGKSEAVVAEKAAETDRFLERYKNPVFNVAVTFLEPLPVALIVTLISAGVLSRRRKSVQAADRSDQEVRPLEGQRA